ncbi:MAG: 2-oxoacid:ferredoxin oxidoreductase subunit beta [Sphingomonadaceae bacterium]
MLGSTALIERTVDDYKSDEKPTWCPGCGDFGVLNAVYNAMKEKRLDPKDVVVVSGIGCSSRLPFFVSTYGFHGVHGRTMPIATGLKVARPDLAVLVMGGDGDALAIGGGHFIHAARRNVNLTYVIMDNSIYGLTKGQTSPTSRAGFTTKTTPRGSVDRSVNPLLLALSAGATFVARGFSGQPKELADLIVQGMEHRGFSVIDVYSPCPTFNKVNTFKFYREMVRSLPPNHPTGDLGEAIRAARSEDPLYVGLFYREEGASFEEGLELQNSGGEEDCHTVLEDLFDRFS